MSADLQALRVELAAYKGLTSRLCDTLGITPAGGTAPDKAAFAALEAYCLRKAEARRKAKELFK
jgi:hypothetical protein